MVAECVGGSAEDLDTSEYICMARTMVNSKSLYTFPIADGGHECPLPSGVLTQALLQHVDQCMQHEDVVK